VIFSLLSPGFFYREWNQNNQCFRTNGWISTCSKGAWAQDYRDLFFRGFCQFVWLNF